MSTLGAVDSGLIPSWVKSITLKLVFAAFLFDAQQRNNVKDKPASLLVVLLKKALSLISLRWCGRQKAGNSEASSL